MMLKAIRKNEWNRIGKKYREYLLELENGYYILTLKSFKTKIQYKVGGRIEKQIHHIDSNHHIYIVEDHPSYFTKKVMRDGELMELEALDFKAYWAPISQKMYVRADCLNQETKIFRSGKLVKKIKTEEVKGFYESDWTGKVYLILKKQKEGYIAYDMKDPVLAIFTDRKLADLKKKIEMTSKMIRKMR